MDCFTGILHFFVTQLKGFTIAFGYSFIVSFFIFKLINIVQPMRVGLRDEELGLDVSQHNENYMQGTLIVKMNDEGVLNDEDKKV